MINVLCLLCLVFSVHAQSDRFKPGTSLPEFGLIAEVPDAEPLPKDSHFKVVFDVVKPASQGGLNRSIESAARFINMHVAAGVPEENIQLAMVIHGKAVLDVSQPNSHQAGDKTHQDLVKALQSKGVEFYVCGQSAAYYGVTDLLPGVKMSLSAMTAHALLQQQGYTLNPF